MTQPDNSKPQLDPLYVSSLRELKWILIAWCVNFAWVIGVCALLGYGDGDTKQVTTILGMPSWVFWGVFLPWIVVTLFIAWFALRVMKDHPLQESETEETSDE